MQHEATERLAGDLRPANLALVFAGGVVGVLARELLMWALPDIGQFPLPVFAANLAGALAIGVLLTVLDAGGRSFARRRLRLLLGTGLLGGFTTYSALAQTVALLLREGSAAVALGYGLGTLLLGALFTWGGIALGALLLRRRNDQDV